MSDDSDRTASLLAPTMPSESSLTALDQQQQRAEQHYATKMLVASAAPPHAANSQPAANSEVMEFESLSAIRDSNGSAVTSLNGHAIVGKGSQSSSSPSPLPIFSNSNTSYHASTSVDAPTSYLAYPPSSPIVSQPDPLVTAIHRCTLCQQLRKIEYPTTAPPDTSVPFVCSHHPDPSLGSCALPMTSVPARLIGYRSMRVVAPYNFMSLGLLPFDDDEYERMFAVSGWNRWETLWLLERVRDEGVEAVMDDIERVGQSRTQQQDVKAEGSDAPHAGLDVLYRRGCAECEARLLHIMSMAALHQHTVSSRHMPFNPFIHHQLVAKDKDETAQQPATEPTSPSEASERPRRVRLSQHERMHTAVVRKRERAAASGRKRKRAGGRGGEAAGDDEDEAFRTGAEIKRTGIRESSGRLAGQKRKMYEDGVDGEEDEEYEFAEDDGAADGGRGRGRREEEDEVVEFRWRIEKILAERQRIVKVDEAGQPIVDSSDSESDDDDGNDPSHPSFHSPRKLRLHREHSTDPVLQPISASPPPIPPGHTMVTEYLVKIETQSYLHVEWHTRQRLIDKFGERNAVDRIGRYNKAKTRQDAMNADRFGGEAFDPRFVIVDRVIASEWVEVDEDTEEESEKERRRKRKKEERERGKREETERAMDDKKAMEEGQKQGSFTERLSTAANGIEALPPATTDFISTTPPTTDEPFSRVEADTTAVDTSSSSPSLPPTSPPPTMSAAPKGKRNVEMFLVKWQGLSYNQSTWESAEDVADENKIAQFRRFNRPPVVAIPAPLYTPDEFALRKDRWYTESPVYKNKGRLREYQVDGLNWLIRAWYEGRNCILADEMGLGKTLQTVTFIEHLRRIEHNPGPYLVIVPLSTLSHWKREVETWTDMNIVVYHDVMRGRESREFIRQHEFYYANSRRVKFHVLCTTYEVLIGDIEILSHLPWQQVTIDEGHRLKNKSSKILEALNVLKVKRRLLLTGTPIQNNTNELFTLLHFLEPDVFSSASAFSASFGHLEESEQVEALQQRIRPYVLRRMKEAVERSIPGKEETIIDIELTMLQKKYYRAIYEKNLAFLRQGVSRSNMPRLVNMEIELRKCCLTGDHRVLTRGGWRSIAEVRRGEEALSFNIQSYEMEWKTVIDVVDHIVDPSNEDDRLYRMQGSEMDVIATGNHRMLLGRLDSHRENTLQLTMPVGYETVAELRAKKLKFTVEANSAVTRFSHSQSRAVVRGGVIRQPPVQIVIPGLERVCRWWWRRDEQVSFLQFLGFWLRDGSLDVTHGLVIISQRTEQSSVWLIDLLERVFPRWWYNIHSATNANGSTCQYKVNCPPMYDYLRLLAIGPIGYNPRDPVQLRTYPHFTKNDSLAAEEQKSRYYTAGKAGGFKNTWTEAAMLAAFDFDTAQDEGLERRWWCLDNEWEEGNERVTCSTEGCNNGGHTQCAVPPLEMDWFCPDCTDRSLQSTVSAMEVEVVEDEGMTTRVPCFEVVEDEGGDEVVGRKLHAEGKSCWYYQPEPVIPPLPAPQPMSTDVHISVGAAVVLWNSGWWIILNSHWFYLKRWLGEPQQIAAVYSRLSRQQAIALLDGFCRADGECGRIAYDESGEPTGMWVCSSSSFPLIDHLQLIAQLAGAAVDLRRTAKAGANRNIYGRTVNVTVDHWQLRLTFTTSGRIPFQCSLLAEPQDVSDDIGERGYYQYEDDNFMHVYCISVDSNTNFLTQRLSEKRLSSGSMAVQAQSIFIGNCQHPWLIAGVEDKEIADGMSDDEYMAKTIAASGKLVLLEKLLIKMQREGHRVLIFSQFVLVLDLLQEFCDYKKYTYERLDGGVRGNEREAAIDRFVKPGSNRFLFLLSTRAGGVGLNLATADTVIIFDSDWNPQQDMQAQARAHRIGQKNKVMIYRLVTRNTYESEMFMRASKKLGLDHAVLTNLERGRGRGGGRRKRGEDEAYAEGDGEVGEEEVDRDAIDKILKLGAYGLFDEEGDQRAIEFEQRDIDEILEKHSHVINFGGGDGTAAGADGGEKKEGDGSGTAETRGERKEGAVSAEGEVEEKDRAGGTGGGAVTQASAAASQFRLNYNKMRFTSEKESSGLDVNDTLFWEKLMGNSAVSLVIPPDELLAQLTDQSAVESTESRAVFVSRLERTAQATLDAKKRGDEADVDALVNLLIQFSATSAFSESERDKASEWLLEAEKRVERRARLRVREDDSADKRRSSRRRGFPEDLRRSGRRSRRGEDEAAEAEGEDALMRGEDSDFSLGDSDAFDDEERTKGGRVRGRAGALMNVDICDVCWTSGSLLGCDGPCERWFHLACLGMDEPPDENAVWLCADCDQKHHTCRICGQRDVDDWKSDKGVRCCSVPKCGLFYHLSCARDNPLTVFYSSNANSSFKCPAHYCYKCAAIGEVYYVHCLCCERAEHVKCMGSSEIRLAKKIIFCEFCVERERHTDRGKAAIEGSIVHTQLPPVREKRKLKRPRKSGSSRRKEGGRTGERRMSRQQWERMTEEEREAETAKRAERRQEQKARARVKQREKRAAKRAARLGLTPVGGAAGGSGDDSDSSSSSTGSSSSSGSSSHSSSSSASNSDSSSSSSSSASSSSSTSSSSSSSSSASSTPSDTDDSPSAYFRPGTYIVRFMLDGEKQYETARQAMFHPTGKRRRKKSKRLDPHKEERRRKKEKRRREREKKDRVRRARHEKRRRKREEEEREKVRKEERAKRGKEEKVQIDERDSQREEKKEAEQKENSDVQMRTEATERVTVKVEEKDDEPMKEELKEEQSQTKVEPDDEKEDGRASSKERKRRSSPAADRPTSAAAATPTATVRVKQEQKDDAESESPTKLSDDRDARSSRRQSRSVSSTVKEDSQQTNKAKQQQDAPVKVELVEPPTQQRRRSNRSPPTVGAETGNIADDDIKGSDTEDRKVRVRVRVRERRHDALVGQGVVGVLRSKRLARIKEEGDVDDADTDENAARDRGNARAELKEDAGSNPAEEKEADTADMDTD